MTKKPISTKAQEVKISRPEASCGVKARKAGQKTVNVALQGGGAHGAFSWGVLDKICEDGRIVIDGLSATSAGAMNVAVYSYGMMTGGPAGARKAMHDFWKDVSDVGQQYSPVKPTFWETLFGGWENLDHSFSYNSFEAFTRMFSPYEFNPLNNNPLRDVLHRHVDFKRIIECDCSKMFICATNVRTNKIKIFRNKEVTCDAVLASACLPMLFQAVEIDGEAYWDGGYIGNPALYPLIYHTNTNDLIILPINPIHRDEIPKTAHDIYNRINEISFNSSLLRELRATTLIKKLVKAAKTETADNVEYKALIDKFRKLNIHSVSADGVTGDLTVASKFSPDWEFLCHLRDCGRNAMESWLDKNFDAIGNRSTLNLQTEFE